MSPFCAPTCFRARHVPGGLVHGRSVHGRPRDGSGIDAAILHAIGIASPLALSTQVSMVTVRWRNRTLLEHYFDIVGRPRVAIVMHFPTTLTWTRTELSTRRCGTAHVSGQTTYCIFTGSLSSGGSTIRRSSLRQFLWHDSRRTRQRERTIRMSCDDFAKRKESASSTCWTGWAAWTHPRSTWRATPTGRRRATKPSPRFCTNRRRIYSSPQRQLRPLATDDDEFTGHIVRVAVPVSLDRREILGLGFVAHVVVEPRIGQGYGTPEKRSPARVLR